MTKKIITLSLDSDVIDTLKKLANGNSSRYTNQVLRKVLSLDDDASKLEERVSALEDFLEPKGFYKSSKKGFQYAKTR